MQYFARNTLINGINAWVSAAKRAVTQNVLPPCCPSNNHPSPAPFFVCPSLPDHRSLPLRCLNDLIVLNVVFTPFLNHLSLLLTVFHISPKRFLLTSSSPRRALSYSKYMLSIQDMSLTMSRKLSFWCVQFLCLPVLSGVSNTCFSFQPSQQAKELRTAFSQVTELSLNHRH